MAGLITGAADGMAAELLPQGGEELGPQRAVLPGAEALLQGRRDCRDGDGKVNRFLNRPASFARVFNEGLQAFQSRVFLKGGGGKVEEP